MPRFDGLFRATIRGLLLCVLTACGGAPTQPFTPPPWIEHLSVDHSTVIVLEDPLVPINQLLTWPPMVEVIDQGQLTTLMREKEGEDPLSAAELLDLIKDQDPYIPRRLTIGVSGEWWAMLNRLIQGMALVGLTGINGGETEQAQLTALRQDLAQLTRELRMPPLVFLAEMRYVQATDALFELIDEALASLPLKPGMLTRNGDETELRFVVGDFVGAMELTLLLSSAYLVGVSNDPVGAELIDAIRAFEIRLKLSRQGERLRMELGQPPRPQRPATFEVPGFAWSPDVQLYVSWQIEGLSETQKSWRALLDRHGAWLDRLKPEESQGLGKVWMGTVQAALDRAPPRGTFQISTRGGLSTRTESAVSTPGTPLPEHRLSRLLPEATVVWLDGRLGLGETLAQEIANQEESDTWLTRFSALRKALLTEGPGIWVGPWALLTRPERGISMSLAPRGEGLPTAQPQGLHDLPWLGVALVTEVAPGQTPGAWVDRLGALYDQGLEGADVPPHFEPYDLKPLPRADIQAFARHRDRPALPWTEGGLLDGTLSARARPHYFVLPGEPPLVVLSTSATLSRAIIEADLKPERRPAPADLKGQLVAWTLLTGDELAQIIDAYRGLTDRMTIAPQSLDAAGRSTGPMSALMADASRLLRGLVRIQFESRESGGRRRSLLQLQPTPSATVR